MLDLRGFRAGGLTCVPRSGLMPGRVQHLVSALEIGTQYGGSLRSLVRACTTCDALRMHKEKLPAPCRIECARSWVAHTASCGCRGLP